MAVFTDEDIISQTEHYLITRSARPFVSREEGGHIRLFPKREGIRSINDLTKEEAIDLILTEQRVRQAMIEAMNERGVPVVWVNILDLGNWAFKRNEEPRLHIHIFGRVAGSKKQVWPEAPYLPDTSTGFYEGNVPLDKDDLEAIKNKLEA